jgi:hypothetical protein
VATTLNLPPPPLPDGFDAPAAGLYLMLEIPLWILVLIGLSRFLAGGLVVRALMLAWLS